MKLKVDKKPNPIYLRLDNSRIAESDGVAPCVTLGFNQKNKVVGVKILRLLERAPNLNINEL